MEHEFSIVKNKYATASVALQKMYIVDADRSYDVRRAYGKDGRIEVFRTWEGEGTVDIKSKGEVILSKWGSAERAIEITAYEPLTMRIKTFNFPGWKAYLDKKPTEIKTEKHIGAMLIDIPQGRHTLVVRFKDTPIRYYAKLLSLVSLVSMVLLVLFSKKIKMKNK